MSSISIKPMNGAENVLSSLKQKITAGSSLTGAEVLMGMTASATQTQAGYGSHPRDAEIRSPDVPESLKGAIASSRT